MVGTVRQADTSCQPSVTLFRRVAYVDVSAPGCERGGRFIKWFDALNTYAFDIRGQGERFGTVQGAAPFWQGNEKAGVGRAVARGAFEKQHLSEFNTFAREKWSSPTTVEKPSSDRAMLNPLVEQWVQQMGHQGACGVFEISDCEKRRRVTAC